MEYSDIRTYIKLLDVKNYFITYPIKNMVWVSYVEDILATSIENITDVHLKITFSYYLFDVTLTVHRR